MHVLTPTTLAEALALKAEHPDAWPIQGGTDLLVDLNFDRQRPALILNLAELEELRGWSREDGLVRLGAGLTYAEAMAERLRERARERASDTVVIGPAPAYIARRAERWRWNLVLRGSDPRQLLDGGLDPPWSVDVDPDSLL